jgi:hypothetical protein
MATQDAWEYRCQRFGSVWREAKDEDIETTLNEWGAEGWEVINTAVESGKVLILAKRPLTSTTRRQRSLPSY